VSEQAGGSGARYARKGPVWRAKLNIEPRGLDIGRTCRESPRDGGGGLWAAGER